MKKIIALVAALAVSVTSLFAYTNLIGVGVQIVSPVEVDHGSDMVSKVNATGLNFTYVGAADGGFSFKYNGNVGFGSYDTLIKGKSMYSMLDPYLQMNIEFNSLFGVGGAIIRNDKFFLGLYGNVGFSVDVCVVGCEMDIGGYDVSATTTLVTPGFLVGGDVTFAFTPSKVFSIYASISANMEIAPLTTSETVASYDGSSHVLDDDSIEIVDPAFKLIPTIGVSWRF